MSDGFLAGITAGGASPERAVIAALVAARADDPMRAIPLSALPPFPRNAFERLLDRGVVREAAPGTFYLYGPSGPVRGRTRLLAARSALLVAILLYLAYLMGAG